MMSANIFTDIVLLLLAAVLTQLSIGLETARLEKSSRETV